MTKKQIKNKMLEIWKNIELRDKNFNYYVNEYKKSSFEDKKCKELYLTFLSNKIEYYEKYKELKNQLKLKF